jgi:hypothetical protein
MLPRQGIRRSNCSTTAIPAFVTVTVTGFVEPSLAGRSAPLDETSNRCATTCSRMRSDVPILSTMYPIAVSGAGSGEPTSASNRNSRAPGTDAAALADVGVDVGEPIRR